MRRSCFTTMMMGEMRKTGRRIVPLSSSSLWWWWWSSGRRKTHINSHRFLVSSAVVVSPRCLSSSSSSSINHSVPPQSSSSSSLLSVGSYFCWTKRVRLKISSYLYIKKVSFPRVDQSIESPNSILLHHQQNEF